MKKHLLTLAAATLVALPLFARTDAQSLIPKDAVTVGVVHIDELRSSALAGPLFQQTDKIASDGDAAQFLIDAGLKPSTDVDTIVVSTSPRTALGQQVDVLVALDGRFDVDRLSTALVSRGAVRKNGYYIIKDSKGDSHPGAAAFPDSHLVLIGSEDAVAEALAARATGGSNFAAASILGHDLARIDPKAAAWALVDVTRAQRINGGPHVTNDTSSGAAFNSALKSVSTVAVWATDAGDQVKLGAFGISSDSETLQLLEDTIRGGLSAMRLAVQDKQPDLVSTLRRFTVSRSSDSVTISGSVPAETFRKFAAQHHTSSK